MLWRTTFMTLVYFHWIWWEQLLFFLQLFQFLSVPGAIISFPLLAWVLFLTGFFTLAMNWLTWYLKYTRNWQGFYLSLIHILCHKAFGKKSNVPAVWLKEKSNFSDISSVKRLSNNYFKTQWLHQSFFGPVDTEKVAFTGVSSHKNYLNR